MSDLKQKGKMSAQRDQKTVAGIATIEHYGKPLASPSITPSQNIGPSAFPLLPSSLKLQNQFSPLTKPFSQAVSSPSPSPSPSKSPSISQNFSSYSTNSAKYFQKSFSIPIEVIESEFGPSDAHPRLFASRIFPTKMHFIPEGFKTRKWYEAILVQTKSIELTHLDHKSQKLLSPTDDQITFSKFKILQVLTVADWGTHILQPRNFSIQTTPSSFTYLDYKNAWYKFLFLRPGTEHSWFIWFRKQIDKFPAWFVEWFYYFGLTSDIFPSFALSAFDFFRQKTLYPSGSRLLHFTINFGITWTFHWDYGFTTPLPAPIPRYLSRTLYIKWWNKFNLEILSPEKLTLWVLKNSTSFHVKTDPPPLENQSQFTLQKSQRLSQLASVSSEEEWAKVWASFSKPVSSSEPKGQNADSETQSSDSHEPEVENKNYFADFFAPGNRIPDNTPLFGHDSERQMSPSQFD